MVLYLIGKKILLYHMILQDLIKFISDFTESRAMASCVFHFLSFSFLLFSSDSLTTKGWVNEY